MERLRKSTRWYVSEIISLLFLLCATIYFKAVEGLNKSAELEDAEVFLFNYPIEYIVCIIFGIIAKIAGLAIFLNAIGTSVCLIYSYIPGTEFFYEKSKIKYLFDYIVNGILVIVTGIIQDKIMVPLEVLLLSVVIIIGGVWLYAANAIKSQSRY